MRILKEETIQGYRNIGMWTRQSRAMTDEELSTLVTDYDIRMKGGTVPTKGWPQNPQNIYYQICGALIVLRQRHGVEYVENLLHIRSPRTIRERIVYLLTGKKPRDMSFYKGD